MGEQIFDSFGIISFYSLRTPSAVWSFLGKEVL